MPNVSHNRNIGLIITMIIRHLLCTSIIIALMNYGLAVNPSLTLLRDAVEKGAVCLDGSPPGYYYRKGFNDPNKWIIHMEGGGYCATVEDCLQRSDTYLGSSSTWPNVIFLEGFLSDNCSENHRFCGWSMVFVPYCDGAFFAGNVIDPVKVGNDTIYFRGIEIIDHVIEALLNLGVNKAEQVVLTGCSAGAHATYLHIDHIRKMIPGDIPLYGFADAGYFLDAPDIHGDYVQRGFIQDIFKMQNLSNGGLNDNCLADMPADEHWKCVFVPYMYRYIKTPVFTYNSPFDTWQLQNTLGLNCLPPNCSTEQMQELENYGQEFLKAISPAIQSSSNGVFIDSCLEHCQSLTTVTWTQFRVNNQTVADTLHAWLTGSSDYKFKEVDCTPFPCNPTCPVTKLLG